MVREYTNRLRDLIEEGYVSHKQIVDEIMCYLSEDEIKRFCLTGFGGELADNFEEFSNE